MKLILVFALFLSATQARFPITNIDVALNEDWEDYKIKFNKNYEFVDEIKRRIIWEQNLKYIEKHNLEYNLGKHTFTLGLNQFADLTNTEFKDKVLGGLMPNRTRNNAVFSPHKNVGQMEDTVDWRTKGYVNVVQNQVR